MSRHPLVSIRRILLATAMLAVCGVSFRRGGTAAVTAFATFGVARNLFTRTGTRTFQKPTVTFKPPNTHLSSSSSETILKAATADIVTSPSLDLEKAYSTTHPSYEVIEKDIVTEYGAYCTLYRHKKSGAELLSVSVDDDNKVFGITLRTPPEDSTGVPHILEHSVLCGSRKYKTKDPFVHLLKGSLQTFLNAFTYPDRKYRLRITNLLRVFIA